MGDITLDPVEDFLDARPLGALIDRWLSVAKGDKTTLAGYKQSVEPFKDWWNYQGPKQHWRLTKSDLDNFEVYLRELESKRTGATLAWNTRNDVLRRLRQMFKWAYTTERTAKNYAEWVPAAYGSAPERLPATPEQLARLMAAALNSPTPLRDQAILAFFIGTGVRLGELVGLTIEELTICADGSGTAFVTGKRTKANKLGRRAVAFDNITGRYLTRYLDAELITSGPLWLTDRGNQLLRGGVYRMTKRMIERAGLTKHIQGCHDLRRNFSTLVGLMHPENPMWADMIRRQLGHKRYSQTAAYTLLQADDIREHIASPLALTEKRG